MSSNLEMFSKSLRGVDETPTLQEYFTTKKSEESIDEPVKLDENDTPRRSAQIDTSVDTSMDSEEFNKRINEMFGGKMDRKMIRRIKKANKSDYSTNLLKAYADKRKNAES